MWALTILGLLLTGAATEADSGARDSEPPSFGGDSVAISPAAPAVYVVAYPDMNSAVAMLDQAAAQAATRGAAAAGEVSQQSVESTVQGSIQGVVWLLVLCLGLMVLAGFNSRKPRSPRHPLDPDRPRLHHAGDVTEPDDGSWRSR
jgi:hypothetical protein